MQRIGNYQIEDIPIGSGGMGHVFRGEDAMGRPVAIKQILPHFVADIEYRSRIEREIEFLKKLHNDHVVRIYDHFEQDGNLYIVMELVEGQNVEQFVASRGAIPWEEAVGYMVQLLNTMQDVHANGIIHRDIKPGNIMIRPDGRICLLDFGVAKDASGQNQGGGTVFGTVIGTDGYMSPEQAGGLSIDHRSDIYGLGCVLYFMLTGEHAFGGMQSELKMQIAITSGQFPPLSGKISKFPRKLQTVLDNAVHKDMTKRYQSCKEFATDLQNIGKSSTHVDTLNRGNNPITVRVGRENCDIIVAPQHNRVSRYHGDITLKRFTGGEFYVYTDRSSNGTVIDGYQLQNGMSYNIPKGANPEILLAGEKDCRLDLNQVISELERKLRQREEESDPTIKGGPVQAAPGFPQVSGQNGYGWQGGPAFMGRNRKGVNPNTFAGAITDCFIKYCDTTGRASRAEYWWFWLFTFIINICLYVITILGGPETIFSMFIICIGIGVLLFLPSWCVMVRRLHDIGKNWVNILYSLIPLVGTIILLVFLLRKGDPGINRFGPPQQ